MCEDITFSDLRTHKNLPEVRIKMTIKLPAFSYLLLLLTSPGLIFRVKYNPLFSKVKSLRRVPVHDYKMHLPVVEKDIAVIYLLLFGN